MVRNVLGVIAGYIVLALCIIIFFTCLYTAIGADGAFKPGTYEPSALWTGAAFALGLVGAVLGGVVCALIARRSGAVTVLVVVILLLGLTEAVFLVMSPPASPGVRDGAVSNFEAATKAIKPVWVAVVNPVLGAIGAWMGGRVVLRSKGA